ncbi:beta-propeller uncharacterized protein DUF5122 [Solirubrobacter pauli]|uniref:Beta-propeller uncharacterized protein DUF5122 n=1 Tax=Solirubrobacter pauli TaxID=166793 RepID=A0A660LJB5_9ACTN|nr:hypothetical protein [Solirubrobacter pauli]RKQ93131.1 beta-propeller uncharacterized protein DUF5122 [Solirubrobacter pauli]
MPRSSLLACLAMLLCAAPASAAPDSAPQSFPAVAGVVSDALLDGDTAYLAGSFAGVGRHSGPLTLVGGDGAVRRSFLDLTSDGPGEGIGYEDVQAQLEVRAIAPDGAGGFFVGGTFDSVVGVRRHGLAHLRADGSLDTTFQPGVSGSVYALQRAGEVLYVGGAFSGPKGNNVVALDTRTGAALDWGHGGRMNGQVTALSVAGDRVFVGGEFSTVAGATRYAAAALDRTTGQLLAWNPGLDGNASVSAIAARDGRVFVGGSLYSAQRTELHGTALFSADDAATLVPWRPGTGETAQLAVGARAVATLEYLDGELRAFDTASRAPLPWFGDVAEQASAIALDGETLYVATFRSGIVAFDLLTGARLPYAGAAAGTVLGAGGGQVATGRRGGGTVDVVPRTAFAAMDVRTGALLPFDPQIAGAVWQNGRYLEPHVNALARAGDALYLGGAFATVAGHAQQHLAAVDARTGAWRPGLPSVQGEVRALAVHGTTLYVGGDVFELGGRQVFGLGAIDLTTGHVLDWAPYDSCPVYSLAVVGSRLLVGRCELRAYDAATRAPIAASALPTGGVFAIEPDGAGGVWLGGTIAGGLQHLDANLAALPAPAVNGRVESLALDGSQLFLGGTFSTIAGEPRWKLGSIDVTTNQPTAFRPEPNVGPSFLLALGGDRLLASGTFSFMTQGATNHFARFGPTGEVPPTVTPGPGTPTDPGPATDPGGGSNPGGATGPGGASDPDGSSAPGGATAPSGSSDPGGASPSPGGSPAPGTRAPSGGSATPAPRVATRAPVTVTRLRDGRVRLRSDAARTVVVRVRDAKTRRVLARRTVKLAKGTRTVRVGKARTRVYVEATWHGGRAVAR